MTKTRFDLEERTYTFAKSVAVFSRALPRTMTNIEYVKQLVRASGSIGANYIEANEAMSKKDFLHRIKICRKESKESMYWLKLIMETNDVSVSKHCVWLKNEAGEFRKIFSAVINKVG